MSHDLAWPSVGRSLLLLALVWWAWSAFVWAANAEEEDSRLFRVVLLVALVMMFLAGVVLPSAFRGEAAAFVASYAAVRFLHLGIYVHAPRRGHAGLTAIAGSGATGALGMTLLGFGAVLAAADAFSYLHLLLVAGVVILAVGEKAAVASPAQSLPTSARLSLYAGVALYVIGYDAFKWRLGGQPSWLDATAVAVMVVLAVVTASLAAWEVCGLVAMTVVALCVARTLHTMRDEQRAAVSP